MSLILAAGRETTKLAPAAERKTIDKPALPSRCGNRNARMRANDFHDLQGIPMLTLWLPIVLSTIAIFVCSFLSWMVFQLHRKDWRKMEHEDAFIERVAELDMAEGSYMFPGVDDPKEMQQEAYLAKYKAGPRGIMTILPAANMGRNLGLTLLFFFVCCCTFAYLADFALKPGSEPGADFLTVFRFVATVALFTFGAAVLQHSIWFRMRVVGHLIESIAYSLIAGAIFAALWP